MRFLRKRGQISLEFLLVFGVLMVMLLYSVRSVTFTGGTSQQVLTIQTALEEKSVANT
ncbi:class III signal peptide-containing protein, partial [Thermococcus sp.]|uniref:class III signal peptide-containing protein n=1 Tax=Thermococcus sp. TaxID=35749 RepID=UPI0026241016